MKGIAVTKFLVCWMLVITSTGLTVQGQQVSVLVGVDAEQIEIGDHLGLSLQVKSPAATAVIWPTLKDTLGSWEVLAQSPIDSSQEGSSLIQKRILTLIHFEPGDHVVPRLPFSYLDQTGSSEISFSRPVFVSVDSIALDDESAYKPIKDIMDAPASWKEYWPFYLLGGSLLLIGGFLFWGIRNRPALEGKLPVITRKPRLPAHERAMRRLSKLEQQKRWQKGDIKGYYDHLTDILRAYMEVEFKIPALESVTDQTLKALRERNFSSKLMEEVGELMARADLAKFAKYQPGDKENLEAMETARGFIREAKRKAEEEKAAAAAALKNQEA
ncbi:MAG: hypothetical protein AAFR61_03930 [Bacteroidota bacterium]